MRIIIAGSRDTNKSPQAFGEYMWNVTNFTVSEVVCGVARGADMLGLSWATAYGKPVAKFYADWDKYGKSAGPIRNGEMADYADGLIAIWDGKSKGTLDMIRQMNKRQKPVELILTN